MYGGLIGNGWVFVVNEQIVISEWLVNRISWVEDSEDQP